MAMVKTIPELAPPKAAAISGVLFAVLMGVSMVVVRLAIPPRQADSGILLAEPHRRNAIRFACQLAPFAGIAFLWFIGVLRNRLGALEDRFFASVFLGSGLLFVASLYASAAFAGALVQAMARGTQSPLSNETYVLLRELAGAFLNVFAIKMAGVFTISTSTILLRTGLVAPWLARLGFACAAVLLLTITSWPWIALVFPFWMLVMSIYLLRTDPTF